MSERRFARDTDRESPDLVGSERPPLWRCPHCDSPFVQLIKAERSEAECISIELICPECLAWMAGDFEADEVAKFMREVRSGKAELKKVYENLVESNMAQMASTFTRALQQDLIGPDDFS